MRPVAEAWKGIQGFVEEYMEERESLEDFGLDGLFLCF
jgi:hypothetical protein